MDNILNTNSIKGKTIAKATFMKDKNHDDEGWLRLDFTDGTYCVIEAGYGCYTGDSADEYPTNIYILSDRSFLIPNQE